MGTSEELLKKKRRNKIRIGIRTAYVLLRLHIHTMLLTQYCNSEDRDKLNEHCAKGQTPKKERTNGDNAKG